MSKDPLHTVWLIADKFREVDPTIPIRWVLTFLFVAQRQDSEDVTQSMIADHVGAPQGVVSKFLQKMSTDGGLGLLKMDRDPTNDTRKVILLTAKGRKLVSDLTTILQAKG